MKKKVLLLLVIAIIGMSGCFDNATKATIDESSKVTPNIVSASEINSGVFYHIIDKNTGVVYLAYNSNYRAGITVMLNRDGSPVTAEQLGIEY